MGIAVRNMIIYMVYAVGRHTTSHLVEFLGQIDILELTAKKFGFTYFQ
jgi:hypothetical protein